MITVCDLTSAFVAHIITPTQAYMYTLTNILAVLPPTQQHTHILPKNQRYLSMLFVIREFVSLAHRFYHSQSNALTLWVSDQSSFSV